jgi:hypothetical protein
MKTIILFLLSFFIFAFADQTLSQDCYTVMKIKGTVFNSSKGKDVAANNELCSFDNLIFKSPNSVIVVHSSSMGRFTIKPESADNKSEFSCIVADVLKSSSGNLSTKSFDQDDFKRSYNLKDELQKNFTLQDEFKGNYNIIGSLRIKVDNTKYPLDENSYFTITYKHNGEKVNKKLEYSSDILIFNKDNIYKVNENIINPEEIGLVTLSYYDELKKTSNDISSFNLYFLEENEIKAEIQKIVEISKFLNQSKDEAFKEALSYMTDTYGTYNVDSFESWYKSNF